MRCLVVTALSGALLSAACGSCSSAKPKPSPAPEAVPPETAAAAPADNAAIAQQQRDALRAKSAALVTPDVARLRARVKERSVVIGHDVVSFAFAPDGTALYAVRSTGGLFRIPLDGSRRKRLYKPSIAVSVHPRSGAVLSLSPRRKRRAQTLSRIDAKSFAVTGFPVPVPPAELQAYDIDIVKAAWSLDGATLVASLVYQRRGIHGDLAPGGRGNLPKWHHSLFALECDSETGLAKPGASWVHRSFAADVGARRFVILENRVVTPRSGAFALPSLEPVEMPKPSGVRTSGLAMRGDVTARITQRSDPKQRIVIAKGDASVELSETDAKPSARILDDSPKISADASWVAYQTTSIGDPYRTIWTCFFETNGGRHLHEAIDAHRVAWSPDGRRVAFTSGNGKLRLLDWPALLAEFP